MWFPSVEKNLCGPALSLSEAKKEWALKVSQANVSGEMKKNELELSHILYIMTSKKLHQNANNKLHPYS